MCASVVVNTRCGRLHGAVLSSFEGYEYCAFKGVPYARPPVGELRFREPLPAEPWSGTRDATNFGSMCAQYDFVTRIVQGSDDCLYLNVYVKSITHNRKLPVMVWIHGGAFMFGAGDDFLFGPDYLLRKDIVLVTINYRVGVLGFLSFGDEVVPGNQGLKDQIMALRWVQDNIENFGGDPNNVTIFGESAGSVAIHYLALSDLTKGLFHRAICQSGVVGNPWCFKSDNENTYKICKALGNNSTEPKKLLKFLQSIDCETLIKAQEKIRNSFQERVQAIFLFGPVVDDKSKEPLIPINPLKAVERGVHVPLILGCNTHEGIISAQGMRQTQFDELNRNFEKCLNPNTIKSLKRIRVTPTDFRHFYFGNEKISENNIEKFIDAWSVSHFTLDIHRALKLQVKHNSGPTYFYNFTYDKDFSIMKSFANVSIDGTSHFDEVQYLFSMRLREILNIERPQRGSATYKVIEQMIELWVNFAMYGRPTPKTSNLIPTYWLPVIDEKVFRTLNIGEELRMENIVSVEEQLSLGKPVKPKL